MSSLSRELVFLILQFLDEEKFKETVHKLEQESGFFFNMKYFEDQVQGGEWEEVERYLSGFTKVDDNRYSMKIFFEIRKQKYLEALDKQDRAKAVDILVKDLKVFSSFNEELYKEITQLLTLENFRENEQLSKYGDTKSARNIMLLELKKLIEANPLFRDKLAFPSLKASRLRTLINQSLNWQHQLCKNPRPNPDIKTLFLDHTCGPPNGARAPPTTNPLVGGLPKQGTFPPLGTHSPFQPAPPSASALAGWMANPNPPAPQVPVANGPAALTAPPNPATLLKRPRTPPSTAAILDYQSADSEHLMKRARPGVQPVDEVKTVNYAGGPSHPQNNASPDDLPKSVARSFNQGSCVMSMDFHPIQQTVLLVGTNVGDIGIWEVGSREKLAQRTFKVWDITVASMPMQAALVKDPAVSVNRTVWSPDGTLLGVAFSKHIVHIYTYNSGSDLRQHLEIDAHVGGVNDLAFSHPNKQLCVITCGDDKTIKVWDAATGRKQYTFEGHEAPVYSVCPHHKESIQFIFSTAIDGKIKAWLYDLLGSRVDYDAPGHWCTTMAYSADGTRLFSCGTSKDGESYLVEWNESEGAIKRTYSGFRKRSSGVVQFDTTRNRFLAAGDEFQIKFWDMDNTNLLTTIDAEGGLPASPRLRFNKEGSLLAVTASDNGIKILANRDGIQMLRGLEARAYDANRVPAEPAVSKPPVGNALGVVSTPGGGGGGDRPNSSSMAGTGMDGPTLNMGGSRVRPRDRVGIDHSGMDGGRTPETKPRIPDEIPDRSKSWKLTEINEQNQCRSTRLPDTLPPNKVARLIYTNAGVALLALASNAVHKLWKWQRNERNPSGKATASVAPALWQPASGILMTNDISETNPEEAVPCIALSKNDSYVMSASGGKVSLFNMMTFKVMTTFMPPPPAATFLAFHPQDNNIIAIGMEDSTIQIYNVRVDEVKSKLKGHQKRITGLAFSNSLNVLVSSGADAQLCMWGTDGWEKRKSKFVQAQPGGRPPSSGDTRVQFHNDQVRLLVVHESQLAVYDASKLDRIRQWVPQSPFAAAISNATYSCDSQLVYTGFVDGSVGVFDAETLRPRCRLAPSVHIPQGVSGSTVYPLVIAAHPAEPNQFALGLSDGGVQVIEPLESEGKWGTGPPADNGAASGVPSGPASGNQGSDQTPRTPAPPLAARSAPTSTPAILDYQSADSEHLIMRARPGVQPVDEVKTVNYFATWPSDSEDAGGPSYSQDDLPKDVVRSFKRGSSVMSMDFHPIQQTVLVVGNNVGDIEIWEVGSRETLAQRTFAVWNDTALSMPTQVALVEDPAVFVNRTVWSPDGTLLGVAFSKHIVHIYTYNSGSDLRQHLEIDAHVGGVNDLAFSHPNKQLCVITCGDDKTIKVWDAATGRKQYTLEGHEAPVYSVCPHHKESIQFGYVQSRSAHVDGVDMQFLFSTAVDGTIKAWLYDGVGSRVDYDAPGHWASRMAYSADGTRLFSCGTSINGKCYLVEWNESLAAIKRTYSGFRQRSAGVVQFDTTRNRFLAAGDEFQIKFWDMDNTNLLTTIHAEGGLPASPRLRFNREGSMLAVISKDDGIKILANRHGIQMLCGLEACRYDANRVPAEPAVSQARFDRRSFSPSDRSSNAASSSIAPFTPRSHYRV